MGEIKREIYNGVDHEVKGIQDNKMMIMDFKSKIYFYKRNSLRNDSMKLTLP